MSTPTTATWRGGVADLVSALAGADISDDSSPSSPPPPYRPSSPDSQAFATSAASSPSRITSDEANPADPILRSSSPHSHPDNEATISNPNPRPSLDQGSDDADAVPNPGPSSRTSNEGIPVAAAHGRSPRSSLDNSNPPASIPRPQPSDADVSPTAAVPGPSSRPALDTQATSQASTNNAAAPGLSAKTKLSRSDWARIKPRGPDGRFIKSPAE
ncbi:uncharacterized protein PFL1_04685 [Pseudozyma flocculosa PF-1]|uniref:Uncharacterized protein n=2 Tax=Pseudozyma flocculosa TaxID=84751 RepID=A0A5C3FDL8_9BASI|nr:uncharacterized protein PFL1_04685 [Pseudozyma flocculosa PF-1]EPQ27941.1 hypothetical protein PFL1_04685 [Pseudozyma flocculosa PF-1]SPO41727.1 uncharacterized protein PSFLO_07209 [Pseudozyma flocculosa]